MRTTSWSATVSCWASDIRSASGGGERRLSPQANGGADNRKIIHGDSNCRDSCSYPGQQPEERFIDVIYLPLLDEDGACQRVLGHGIDVTGHVKLRKKAEKALREAEERFRRAFEIDTVGVIFFDRENRITEANEAFLKMSGFSREGTSAGLLRCEDLSPTEWSTVSTRALEELKATGHISPYEKELFRKDGSRWWALIAAKELNDNECVGYLVDITERKRAEQSLRESETRFRAIAEASAGVDVASGSQGNAVYLNSDFWTYSAFPWRI